MQLANRSHYSLAEPLLREAVELNRKILGEEHEQVANSLKNLADVCHAQGKYDAAESDYRAALAIRRKQLGENDVSVADTVLSLATTLHCRGNASAAATTVREALTTYERLGALDLPAAVEARRHLAQVLIELGDLDKAGPLARDALGRMRALYGDHHPSTALAKRTYGRLLIEQGFAGKAECLLGECTATYACLDLGEGNVMATSGLKAEADSALGYCLLAQKRFDEAEPLLLESYRKMQAARGDRHIGTRTALDRIVVLYESWGKPEQARRWRAKSETAPPPR